MWGIFCGQINDIHNSNIFLCQLVRDLILKIKAHNSLLKLIADHKCVIYTCSSYIVYQIEHLTWLHNEC